MASLILWAVLGALCAEFLAFVLSHFKPWSLRRLAVVCLVLYAIGFGMLASNPASMFAPHPLAATWKPLLAGWVAFALVVAYFIPTYMHANLGSQQGTLRRVMFPFRAMALTFDDGPSPEWTPRVLEVLKRHQVKATFFMVGEYVERYPEIAQAVKAAGHTIGSHSYGHRPLPLLPRAGLEEDLDRAEAAFERVLGAKPRYFRPPWGFYNRSVLDELRSRGYLTVLWTRSSQDWRNPGVERIVDLSTRDADLGEIVLLHDAENHPRRPDDPGRQQTVEALDAIIPMMERRGFQFKALDEMVAAWLS